MRGCKNCINIISVCSISVCIYACLVTAGHLEVGTVKFSTLLTLDLTLPLLCFVSFYLLF